MCKRGLAAAVTALSCLLLAACAPRAREDAVPDMTPPASEWSNPERVQILGYSDNATNNSVTMEPFISRDGKYLFFNNSNDPNVDTNLYWATRVDDITFQFQGELGGVNSPSLDAVASMDDKNNFYFITTRSYFDAGASGYLSTIYSGSFSNGKVSGVGPVAGTAAPRPGIVDFDAEISADGNTLYFSQGLFKGGSVPASAQINIATRDGDKFVVSPNSDAIMANINSSALDYAPDTNASQLEFYFTRLNPGGKTAIYMATRTSTSSPFGKPRKITAITGFAEAPTISPDGKSLYYHAQENGVFVIKRVTRAPGP
jgi:hypothetical protein